MDDIVESIQQDILRPEVGLNTILLKAKLLAYHLKNNRFKQWVKYELDGYPDTDILPNYRIIYTPLLAYISNGWNGCKNLPISLYSTPDWFQETADKIHFYPGIKTVEEYAASQNSITFAWSAEQIALWNYYNPLGSGGHECYEVKRPVSYSVFAQILLTVRSRLQDFVFELSDLPWKMPKDSSLLSDQIEQLVSLTIYNNAQGGNVATFDQREQQVQNQNNAVRDINIKGDINIGTIQNSNDFIRELQKVKSELSKAGDAQIISAEIVTDADYEIATAIQEAKKATPNKNFVLKAIENAKNLLSKSAGAVELVTALINLIAAGITLF
ncbi:AbiTii domain-containing protein [Nostoc sp.]|uniref:AbiTii domain-containing protein n=1 Tax=Nostoc sp. TaxID=1180 RepID=UPI002FF7C76E